MKYIDSIKVLYICVSGPGGSNQALLSSLRELQEKNIKPLVVVPDKDTAKIYNSHFFDSKVIYMRQEVKPSCKTFKSVLLFVPIFLFNLTVNFIALLRLMKVCVSFKPNIIHSNITVTTLGYILSKIFRLPHVWHIREYVQQPMIGKKFVSRLLNKTNTILITKGLQSFYKIASSHSRVIYDGITYKSSTSSLNTLYDNRYFVCVGRITPAKGANLLIESFISFALNNNTIDLLFVGEGKISYITELKKMLQTYGLENRVHFVGHKNHEDTMRIMENAEALIVASLSEGFGLITAEAMFCKCLVIGNNNTGTKEQLDNGLEIIGEEVGFRFNNAQELTQVMNVVCTNGKGYYQNIINNL